MLLQLMEPVVLNIENVMICERIQIYEVLANIAKAQRLTADYRGGGTGHETNDDGEIRGEESDEIKLSFRGRIEPKDWKVDGTKQVKIMRSTPVIWRVLKNMAMSEEGVAIFQKEPALLGKLMIFLGKYRNHF